jgi:hypothetical protein
MKSANIEVGFKADIEQQQDGARPGEGLQQIARDRIAAKERGEHARREVAQHGGADDNSGEQLTDDRGLAQTFGHVAQHAAHQQKHGELNEEAKDLRFAQVRQGICSQGKGAHPNRGARIRIQ